jgi:hypothetical protein
MDSLPLELCEQIFSNLIPLPDPKQLVALPSSTKSGRSDIYNLRLTSKRIYQGAFQSFVSLVQDVPTQCTEESWEKFGKLIELPNICNSMTRLALSISKLRILSSRESLKGNPQTDSHVTWLKEQLPVVLVSIVRKAPRLRSLVYTLNGLLIHGNEEREEELGSRRERVSRPGSAMELDPFHVSSIPSRFHLILSRARSHVSVSSLLMP